MAEKSVMSGGYVYLAVPERKRQHIIELLTRHGISEDRIIPDLHMTVMYDPSNPTIEIDLITDRQSFIAWPIGFKGLGPTQTEYFCLELESTSAEKLRAKLEASGMKGTFPEFIPHISLIKDPKSWEIEVIKSIEQNILNQCFTFDGPFWEQTKDDY